MEVFGGFKNLTGFYSNLIKIAKLKFKQKTFCFYKNPFNHFKTLMKPSKLLTNEFSSSTYQFTFLPRNYNHHQPREIFKFYAVYKQ
jgi:hypothetical protein